MGAFKDSGFVDNNADVSAGVVVVPAVAGAFLAIRSLSIFVGATALRVWIEDENGAVVFPGGFYPVNGGLDKVFTTRTFRSPTAGKGLLVRSSGAGAVSCAIEAFVDNA
jgi:hypothetical protein